jgi:hypothetical protein
MEEHLIRTESDKLLIADQPHHRAMRNDHPLGKPVDPEVYMT